MSKKFNRIVKNLFSKLVIDVVSGWDDEEERGAADYVTEILSNYNQSPNKSKIFDEYEQHILLNFLQ